METRKRSSSVSPYRENSASSRLLYDGQNNIHSPTNTALLLENIKQEAESTPVKTRSVSKRRSSFDVTEVDFCADSVRYSLKLCKHEEDSLADDGDTTFALFASLLDSALQGF
jgi:nuclear pore complex protein Nup107